MENSWDFLQESRDIVLFLHPPKSAGSSFKKSISLSKNWDLVDCSSVAPDQVCSCGTQSCEKVRTSREHYLRILNSGLSGNGAVIDFGHRSLDSVTSWLATNPIPRKNENFEQKLTLVIPYRKELDRVVSAYKFYWSRSFGITTHYLDEEFPEHFSRIKASYASDSLHYLRGDGSIDVDLWFQAFNSFGLGGVPFFSSEIFPVESLRLLKTFDIRTRIVDVRYLSGFMSKEFGVVNYRSNISASIPILNQTLSQARTLAKTLVSQRPIPKSVSTWMIRNRVSTQALALF